MREILKHLLEQSDGQADDWHPPVGVLREAWPGLVGDDLADVSRPVAVDWEAARLVLEAASGAWQRELRRHDDHLLARLSQVLPWPLETLEVRTGMIADDQRSPDTQSDTTPVPQPVQSETRHPALDPVEIPEDVEESLSTLGDDTASTARKILEHVKGEEGE